MRNSKKIFDIIPPETPVTFPEEIREENSPFPAERKGKSTKKGVVLGSVFFLVMLGIFCYFFIEAKSEIEIWPETEAYNFKEEMTISSLVMTPDFETLRFPGEIIEEEKEISQQFNSSGEKEVLEKARGIIRVYNNYSTQAITFISGTRFVSDSGKVFITKEKNTIPGKRREGGKLVLGEVDVQVIAVKAGPGYNIGPSAFSIPGLQGTALYTAFYGKSFSPMEGGRSAKVSYITQEDLDQAKEKLTRMAFKEGSQSLKNQASGEFIILDDALNQEVVDVFCPFKVDDEAETFLYRVKIKTKGIFFSRKDIENFVLKYVQDKISPDKELYSKSLNMGFILKNLDLKEGEMLLEASGSILTYSKIEEVSLKEAIKGKNSPLTVRYILENYPGIIKAEVKLWPFWVKNIPQKSEKIKVKLNFGQRVD